MDKIKNFFSPVIERHRSIKDNFYKIEGQASFKVEVTVAGNPPYSACLLSVVSMQNSSNKLVIASKCDWYRIFHSQNILMKGNGNTYRVSALDIGSRIVVRVTPTEPDEVGEALITFGPI